jgi:hypothetical protein
MTRRYDEITFRRRLRNVLTADGLWSRMFSRGVLRSGVKPPVVLIFGGTPTGYQLLWTASFLASFLLPDQWLPGGVLVLPSIVLFAWPVIAIVVRKRAVKRCRPTEAAGFVTGVRGLAPEVPESFIMAAREALAAAYCVPVELIGHADTRRRIMALSALNQPIALEVIADICQREGIMWNYERMYAAAKPFKKLRPKNVAELVQVLHREMKTAQLVSGGSGPGAS